MSVYKCVCADVIVQQYNKTSVVEDKHVYNNSSDWSKSIRSISPSIKSSVQDVRLGTLHNIHSFSISTSYNNSTQESNAVYDVTREGHARNIEKNILVACSGLLMENLNDKAEQIIN